MTQPLDLQNILTALNVPIPIRAAASQTTTEAETEWLNLILAFLSTPQFGSFPVSAWDDGSPFKALLQAEAYNFADLSATMYNVVAGGILDLATGPWLDLWGQGLYLENRNPAVQEVMYLWITTTNAINLTPGELIVNTTTNQQYTAVTQTGLDSFGKPVYVQAAVSVGANLTNQQIIVQAVTATAGSAGNTAEGAVLLITAPTGLGFTVTNQDPTNNHNWELVKGEDAETDDAYRIRLKARWPALALLRGSTVDAWGYWITQADPNVSQWHVLENTPTGGQVTIYVDPPTEVTAVDNWVNGSAGPPIIPAHRPLCTTVFVYGSTTTTVTLTGNIYTSLNVINATSQLQTALNNYGGVLQMGSKAYYSIVLGLCQAQAGATGYCENIKMNGAAADVSLAADAIPQFDISGLTITQI
jgi:hypothetical protein